MKKIILLIVIIMAISLFVGCNKSGDTITRYSKNSIILEVYGYDWDILKNIVEETQENYPEYELTKYLTYFITNRVDFIFEKKGE